MIEQRFLFTIKILSVFVLVLGLLTSLLAQEPADLTQEASFDGEALDSIKHVLPGDVNDDGVALDSVVVKKFVSGLELVIDYGKLLTLWTEFESKYEAGINLRFFERMVLAGEFGYSNLNPLKAYDNALYYQVKGSYARFGLDYYTSYDPKSFYYAGVRYGMSQFQDEGMFLIDSEYWEDYEEGFGSEGISASWFELVLGTETYLKLSKKNPESPVSKLLLGWKFRFRILGEFTNREEPRIYSIPGYGRTFDKTIPALNLYMKYRFGN